MSEYGQTATRRRFLTVSAAVAAASILPSKNFSQVQDRERDQAIAEQELARDPRRPQFHLLPARNWMNDPNGPIYFNGQYHMFFQYNPHGAVWGDMSWNHAISSDMLHWSHLPLALKPTPDSPDSYGCFSGSALQVKNRVYQIYTGTKLASKELATIRDGEDKIQESQCIAWSDDPRLVQWTKLPKPIVPLPPEGMRITGFRDPSVWKQGEWYYMTVGAGEAQVGGCVLLYRSKILDDPGSWTYLHKLTSGKWNGNKTANPCDDGEMWECPDFFALNDGHVLIYSTLGKVFWQSGRLDSTTMRFTAAKSGELDLGAFYAPKTQLDVHGRRILWGWIQERRSDAEMLHAGWSGVMSLPRLLTLDADGTLRVEALPETKSLRRSIIAPEVTDSSQSITLKQASGELVCTGVPGRKLILTVRTGSQNLIHGAYDPAGHKVLLDGKEIILKATDMPSFHIFVDGSVLEVIVGSRIGYTKRFYYPGNAAPDVTAVGSGDDITMQGWSLTPISPNRLTTPSKTS